MRRRILTAALVGIAVTALVAHGQDGADAKPTIPELVASLRSDDTSIRQKAVYALWQRRDEAADAAPALAVAIRDRDDYVRTTAAKTLPYVVSGSAESVADLDLALRDERVDVRIAAAKGLASVGPAMRGALTTILGALDDEDTQVRTGAAGALAWLGPDDADEVMPALRAALDSEDAGVRQWVMNAVFTLDVPEGVTIAGECLDDPSPLVRDRALAIIASSGPDPAVPLERILLQVGDGQWSIRSAALKSLAAYPGSAERLVPVLLWSAGDDHGWVRAAAIGTLQSLGQLDARAVPVLRATLGDKEVITRFAALTATRSLGDDAAPLIDALRAQLLAATNKLERSEVARTLGDLGGVAAGAVPELTKLADGTGMLAVSSAYALCAIDEGEAERVGALVTALDDAMTQQAAARYLGALGPRAVAARPALLERVDTTGGILAVPAAAALLRISDQDDVVARGTLTRALEGAAGPQRQRLAAQVLRDVPRCAAWSVPALTAALHVDELRVRREAASTLGVLGTVAQSALPALRSLATERDFALRTAGRQAIRAIERE